jgi:hypothetical protein
MNIRDSSSPAVPQNDSAYDFFRSLFNPAEPAAWNSLFVSRRAQIVPPSCARREAWKQLGRSWNGGPALPLRGEKLRLVRPSKRYARVAQGDDLRLGLQAALELGTEEGKQKEKLSCQWKRKGSISGSDKTNHVNRHRTGVRERAQDYAGQ